MLESIKKYKIEELNDKINNIEKQIKELEEEQKNLPNSISNVTPVSNINKIFKTKKYKNYINNLKVEEEEKENKKRIINDEINKLKNEKYKIENEIDRITKTTLVEQLKLSEKEIYDLTQKYNIETTTVEKLTYMSSIYATNVEFMRKAIKENQFLIKYDKTNDISVYIDFIKKNSEEIRNKDFFSSAEAVSLDDSEKVLEYLANANLNNPETKAFVNHLYEKIKSVAKSEKIFSINIEKLSKLYNSEYGKELESLFLNPNIVVGTHATHYITEDHNQNGIFINGLRNSVQTGPTKSIRRLVRTVAYEKTFLDYLDVSNETYYIITIPKEALTGEVPIWGSDKENSDENYLLPEYIYGLAKEDKEGNVSIIKNDVKGKKTYPVLYADDSDTPFKSFSK